MEKNEQKIYAFVDSQNLNQGTIKNGWKLDYKKFRNYLATKYNVSEAFLFIGYVEDNAPLYKYLEEAGFKMIYKPVMEIEREEKVTYKGNVDAELVLHAMIHINDFDEAIIVSGDGDFFCLVEYLAQVGKLDKVIVPNERYSSLLRKYSEYIVPLGLVKSKLKLDNYQRHGRQKQKLNAQAKGGQAKVQQNKERHSRSKK
jgi:uncharacterized LabA/DUF88 family protein